MDANPELRELSARYRAVSRATGAPVPAVASRDFNQPPIVDAIDDDAYRGKKGRRVRAHDDFEVCNVTVTIRTGKQVVESGQAVRQVDDSWRYTTTKPATGVVTVEVIARDWPNHTGERRVTVDLSGPRVKNDTPRNRLMEQVRALAVRKGSYVTRRGEQRVNYFDKYRMAHSPALLRGLAELMLKHLPRTPTPSPGWRWAASRLPRCYPSSRTGRSSSSASSRRIGAPGPPPRAENSPAVTSCW